MVWIVTLLRSFTVESTFFIFHVLSLCDMSQRKKNSIMCVCKRRQAHYDWGEDRVYVIDVNSKRISFLKIRMFHLLFIGINHLLSPDDENEHSLWIFFSIYGKNSSSRILYRLKIQWNVLWWEYAYECAKYVITKPDLINGKRITNET